MAESEEGLKSLLMRVKRGVKTGLKFNIETTTIMSSSPTNSWQVEGGKVGAVTDFIFFGSKITLDSDYSHEVKRRLHLGRKAMTNLGSVLKSKGSTLLSKICIVKAMAFPVVMYE